MRRIGYALALVLGLAGAGLADAGQNTLTWTDNANNETSFSIERKADACAGAVTFVALATTAANVATYVDTAVTDGTTYAYRLRALNAGGASGYSNCAERTVPFTPPAAPSGLGISG